MEKEEIILSLKNIEFLGPKLKPIIVGRAFSLLAINLGSIISIP